MFLHERQGVSVGMSALAGASSCCRVLAEVQTKLKLAILIFVFDLLQRAIW